MSDDRSPPYRRNAWAAGNFRRRRLLLIVAAIGCSVAFGGVAQERQTRPTITAKTLAPTQSPAAPAARASADLGPWKPLDRDGLHDPANPALPLLQQPREALSVLPSAQEGNHVDWVQALRSRSIEPRTNVYPETNIKVIDLDVLMPDTAGMPQVLFPHRPHTEWLDCSNCHDKIFIPKAGGNPVNMLKILEGEYCGQCHGAVSFPLTQCRRCHTVPTKTAETGSDQP